MADFDEDGARSRTGISKADIFLPSKVRIENRSKKIIVGICLELDLNLLSFGGRSPPEFDKVHPRQRYSLRHKGAHFRIVLKLFNGSDLNREPVSVSDSGNELDKFRLILVMHSL